MTTNGEDAGREHPERTSRSGHRYFFYKKHHLPNVRRIAQWAADVTEAEEFGIFNTADLLDLSDGTGNLFGLRVGPGKEILVLGTLQQQVAEFPKAEPNQAWHGYPIGLLIGMGEPHPPIRPVPVEVLQKMVDQGLLSTAQKRRLRKGDHV